MDEQNKQSRMKLWFKRVGVLGLLFFTIKGLIWLGIFLFAASKCDN